MTCSDSRDPTGTVDSGMEKELRQTAWRGKMFSNKNDTTGSMFDPNQCPRIYCSYITHKRVKRVHRQRGRIYLTWLWLFLFSYVRCHSEMVLNVETTRQEERDLRRSNTESMPWIDCEFSIFGRGFQRTSTEFIGEYNKCTLKAKTKTTNNMGTSRKQYCHFIPLRKHAYSNI